MNGSSKRTFKHTAERLSWSRSARQASAAASPSDYHTADASLTRQVFGVSRASLYRWRNRWSPGDPSSLEDRCSRPHRLRAPTWSTELVDAVLQPAVPALGQGQAGCATPATPPRPPPSGASCATSGRAADSGSSPRPSAGPPRTPAPPLHGAQAPRLPRPGSRRDSVQIDTLDVQILPVVRLKQFTAGDLMISATTVSGTRIRSRIGAAPGANKPPL